MTTTITTAVYENGILRPAVPLDLKDGEEVRIVVSSPFIDSVPQQDLPESARRIRDAKTWDEWLAAAEAAAETEPDDGYDLLEALNENRRAAGVPRLLFPPEEKGITW